ncbi:hypothetical protein, partial [Nonomuraea lactucae]|uniref:hypothetical protein n=1 Tax=Nonomuraea lactucae TaxID=2249762 RepID=UPI0013B44FF6
LSGATRTPAASRAAPTAQGDEPRRSPSGEPRAARPMPTTSTTRTTIPGTHITLHENPADPVWATSAYGALGDGAPAQVRDPKSGEFRYFGNFQQPMVSPDGGYVVALSTVSYVRTDYNTIRLVTRATGEDVELRTADKPRVTGSPVWNIDGHRLLMSVYNDDTRETTGFLLVDAATKQVRTHLADTGGKSGYLWGPDPATLMRQDRDGTISIVGLDGRVVRSFQKKGTLLRTSAAALLIGTASTPASTPASASVPTTVFATTCPGGSRDACLWDAATGARKAVVPLDAHTAFNGWLDDRHFLATITKGATTRLALVGLDGRTRRVLAEGPAKEFGQVSVVYTAK